jgi:hypothetical protein
LWRGFWAWACGVLAAATQAVGGVKYGQARHELRQAAPYCVFGVKMPLYAAVAAAAAAAGDSAAQGGEWGGSDGDATS